MTDPAPIVSEYLTSQEPMTKIGRFAALASLAQSYVTGRISDCQYVEAATALGLTREQAIDRVMIHDEAMKR
jgi:hypothetical protein